MCAGCFAVVTVAALIGCSEELTPRAPYDEAPFSLYGVLSPDFETQSIRVYVPEAFPSFGSPESLDVVFTSTDLTTGDVVIWQDSVVQDPNGQYEHLFRAPFRAEYDRWYRIEVERRSDGVGSHVEVKVPPKVSAKGLNLEGGALPLFFEGERLRVLKPEITYTLQLAGNPKSPALSYTFSYQGEEYPVDEGWKVDVRLFHDRVWAQSFYNNEAPALTGSECFKIRLLGMKLNAIIGDSVWNPPDGFFDFDLMAQPGVFQNVENGFGFVGSGYRITEDVYPSREVVEASCFAYAPPCARVGANCDP